VASGLSPLACLRRRWASAQPSLISLDCRVRLPDLQLGALGQARSTAGYANFKSGERPRDHAAHGAPAVPGAS
jgi:hypothetical protein